MTVQTQREHVSPPTHNSRDLAVAAARATAELRGRDIIVLDMKDHTSLFDYFVIATGTSRRQVHAMADEVDDVLEKQMGDKRLHVEGYDEGRWVILDYGDVIIHLFDEETRMFYSLEDLWSDAKPLDLSEPLAAFTEQLRPLELPTRRVTNATSEESDSDPADMTPSDL